MSHGQLENWGYVADPALAEAEAEACFDRYGASIDDLPRNMDKSAFPYRAAAQILKGNRKYVDSNGLLLALSQGSHGSCVGWGEARKILITLAAGVFLRGLKIDWPTDANGLPVAPSPSWQYGAARQAANNLGRWEGASGAGAAKATEELGFIWEKPYAGFDCSTYKTADCDRWEAAGVPKTSLQFADDNLLKGRTRVTTCEQLVGLTQAGYAINICGPGKPSSSNRDEYGYIDCGSRRWAHSMTGGICYVVYKIKPGKVFRGFGILNSHGNKKYKGGKGSLTPDLPDGAYITSWADMQETLNRRDSWVNFELEGLRPPQRGAERRLAA